MCVVKVSVYLKRHVFVMSLRGVFFFFFFFFFLRIFVLFVVLLLYLVDLITKTRLYNVDSLKPHFNIVKLEFTGIYIIFLISAQNIVMGTR